eukprot:TRINITY_DN7899_c0_g2_i3.p1 TRINITY_DN7899_c0_g2~~TRINITY_DN7899_c0_g2_i3.p1  ORF type:complete len:569 (+),score=88.45 TRINITY_DN7899_c0_g2_i3:140-1708(+)
METVVFIAAAFFVGLHTAMRMMHYKRRFNNASFIDVVRRQLQNVLGWFMKLCRGPRSDALDTSVEEKFNMRRIAAAKSFCLAAANVISLNSVILLWNMAQDRPRWMTIWQSGITICSLAVCLCTYAFLTLTPGSLDLVYALLMMLAAMFTGSGSPDYFPYTLICSLWFRYVFSLVYQKMHGVIFWTLAITCTSLVYTWQNPSADSSGLAIVFEASSSMVLILIVSAVKKWNLATIRQEIDVGNLKMEKTGAMSLLDMVCDVVLELTSDLAIRQDSRGFAALLLRSSAQSLEGSPFADFIASEEERDSVLTKLSATVVDSEASVGTCRAKLLDSLRNPVDVEMFFVKVSMHDGSCHYLLGIREITDAKMPEMPAFKSEYSIEKKRDLANKGTPCSLEHVSLEAREAPLTPVAVRTSQSCRFSELAPTRLDAMAFKVMTAMAEWNATVPRAFCCSFHAYSRTLRIVEKQLSQLKCIPDFPTPGPTGTQCQQCGLFQTLNVDAEAACTICGSGDFKLIGPLNMSL